MISPQFRPMVGGYERAAERLSIELVERGHTVEVWAERRQVLWPRYEQMDGITIRRWWCHYSHGYHTITSLVGLTVRLLVHGWRFDIWHVHQYGVHAGLAVALGFVFRKPIILKMTSSSYMGVMKALENGRFPRLMKRLHRNVDAVVALTDETAADAESLGIPITRIHILGNGVDMRKFQPKTHQYQKTLRNQLQLNENLNVLFVGRLSPEKNVMGLLNAWALTIPLLSERWSLIIVGDGVQRDELREEADRLCISDSVIFAGQQNNVADWLAISDIFVLPSDREGLSNSMLEAMAMALPVVVTSVSGTKELVEDAGTGIRVPIGDTKAFAEALVLLAGDYSMRTKMGGKGLSLVQTRFAVEKVAQMHEALYQTFQK
jgi:glycosyltransferase involved in cell wall biosynthesis